MEYCKEIVANLERKILPINSRFNRVFEEIEMGIFNSKATLKKLRIRISTEGFLSPADECLFFKTIKPKPLGYLIYYLTLTEFETDRPQASAKKIKKYIQDHLFKYQSYYLEHKNFYKYLKRNRTDRDSEYFLRSSGIIKFHPDVLLYCVDDGFSTSHDFIVAKFFAHNLLIERLCNELKALENPPQLSTPQPQLPFHLQWTGNKVDLTELIYALHEAAVINNGNIDIKELVTTFQSLLNVDLGDYYRAFIEIRSRKINTTKFLDRMTNSLKLKMTQIDG